MSQKIVLSPTTIKRAAELTPDQLFELGSRLKGVLFLLDQNKYLLHEVGEAIKAIDDKNSFATKQILLALYSYIDNHCDRSANYHCSPRVKEKWNSLETERGIVEEDYWKIIVAENIPPRILKQTEEESIEVSTIHNFLSPAPTSKIRRSESIDVRIGEKFDLANWVLKYVADEKMIQIEDPYLAADNSFVNLESILRQLHPGTTVILKGIKSRLNQKAEYTNRSPKENLNSIKNQLPITIQLNEVENIFSDRNIKTNGYNLSLGHALVSVDPRTMKAKTEFSVYSVKI